MRGTIDMGTAMGTGGKVCSDCGDRGAVSFGGGLSKP